MEEGREDEFVNAVVALMKTKYEAIPENSGKPFIDSPCASKLVDSLRTSLGFRWAKSRWLLNYFERCLDILEASETVSGITESEPVLAWTSDSCREALKFIRSICCLISSEIPEPWYRKWTELRMRSVEATSEVWR